MAGTNRMAKLAERPFGMAKRENFAIEDGPVPSPATVSFGLGSNMSRSIPPCALG